MPEDAHTTATPPTSVSRTLDQFRALDERTLLLRYIQPGLVGLIDGTLSTLAPIFSAALLSGSHTALFVGLATAVGAGISMGFSEALSDTGTETGRGSGIARGVVTGAMTTLGGVFHSLPFVISDRNTALVVAGIVVAVELVVISLVRKRYLSVPLRISLLQVALAGALIVAAGVLLGSA
jgi:erythrin-vacuolar iron transport family protein